MRNLSRKSCGATTEETPISVFSATYIAAQMRRRWQVKVASSVTVGQREGSRRIWASRSKESEIRVPASIAFVLAPGTINRVGARLARAYPRMRGAIAPPIALRSRKSALPPPPSAFAIRTHHRYVSAAFTFAELARLRALRALLSKAILSFSLSLSRARI